MEWIVEKIKFSQYHSLNRLGSIIFFLIFTSFTLTLISGCQTSRQMTGSPESMVRLDPTVIIQRISPVRGDSVILSGQVYGIAPEKCKIIILTSSDSDQHNKPSLQTPFIYPDKDGQWSCKLVENEQPTRISAYLMSEQFSLSQIQEIINLPGDLEPFTLMATMVMIDRGEIYRIIDFSDRLWRVKECLTKCGPGSNRFSASHQNVRVDEQGRLHMRIRKEASDWTCSEVVLMENLGYGEYQFHIETTDYLDKQAVLGLFTWDNDRAQNHREIDIELSQWGFPDNKNAQYVVQPFRTEENMYRFDVDCSQARMYAFSWHPDSIVGYTQTSDGVIGDRWLYTGPDIPEPGNENARINLWLYEGHEPARETEIIITRFIYNPVVIE
jgi:hypothetical protein